MEEKSDIEDINREITRIKQNTIVHFRGLNEEQLNWKQSRDSWSIGQCFDHLYLTGKAYLFQIEPMLENKNHKNNIITRNFYKFLGPKLINHFGPNTRSRLQAPNMFTPGKLIYGPEVIREFLNLQDQIRDLLNTSPASDLNNKVVRSPVNSLIGFILSDCFKLLINHEKRHMLQAQGVMKSIDFPKNFEETVTK